PQHVLAAQSFESAGAVCQVNIELCSGLGKQGFAVAIAENAGAGVIAVQNLAFQGSAIQSHRIALEDLAVPLRGGVWLTAHGNSGGSCPARSWCGMLGLFGGMVPLVSHAL